MSEDRSAHSLVTEAADWAGITADRLGKRQYAKAKESNQSVVDLLGRALPQMAPAPVDTPPDDGGPSVDPLAEDWANWVSGAPMLTGPQKWKPGSLGCDVFVPRGTIVRAPWAGRATFQSVADTVGPHGELVLMRGDGRTVRFRHVLSQGDGGDVALGQPVALVYDGSLDLLHWPAGLPTPPDGYQHVDVSLATEPAALDPSGGGGGNIPAFSYLEQHGALDGATVIPQTPGPVQGMGG